MAATLPAADFNINTLNLWFGNGVSNHQLYKDLFKMFASVTGLSTEALLKIGKHAAEAPAGFFSALGEINGQNVTDAASYEAALLATATSNTANVNCASVLKPYSTGFQKAFLNFAEVNNATSLINGIITSSTAASASTPVAATVFPEYPLKVTGSPSAVVSIGDWFQNTYCNSTVTGNIFGRNATYDTMYFTNAFASISDTTTTTNLASFRTAWDSICTSLASGSAIGTIQGNINTTAISISAYSTQLTDALVNSTLNTAWATAQSNLPSIRGGCKTTTPSTPLVDLYNNFTTNPVSLSSVEGNFADVIIQAANDLGSNALYYQQICGLNQASTDDWNFCAVEVSV